MSRLLRQTAVIARRDFIATVATPTFLIFLLAPFFIVAFGAVGSLGASRVGHGREAPSEIVAMVAPDIGRALSAADEALRPIYREQQAPPRLRIMPAADEPAARALFQRDGIDTAAVLIGPLDSPSILVSPSGERTGAYLARLAEDALRAERAGLAADTELSRATILPVETAPPIKQAREALGYGAVFLLFFLTLLLAGQAVGTMAEEKSNKVIEILAAAVPLEAVFLGKLVGMFGVALLFISFWGGLALLALTQLPMGMAFAAHISPAIGLPGFVLLGAAYFTMAYLLLGAVFLGVGAQAGTVREIQLLSLPITLFQVGMFGLSSAAAANPASTVAYIAQIFPFSSPFGMIARAATDPALWPHLIALGWQLLWVALTIILAARLFRRGVLSSGSIRLFRRG